MLYAPLDSNHIPLVSPGAGLLDFLIKSKVIAVGFFFFPFSVTKRSEKSNQTFFFSSLNPTFCCFSSSLTQMRSSWNLCDSTTDRQTHWLHPADTHAAAAARGAWTLRPFLSTLSVTRPGAAAAPESAELRWDDGPTLVGKKRWKDWANSKLWAPVVSVYRVAPNHQLQQNQSDFQRSAILSFS